MEARGSRLARVVGWVVRLIMAVTLVGLAVLILATAAVALSPEVETRLANDFAPGTAPSRGELLLILAACAALLAAVSAMLHRLARVARTVERGEPFDPRNPRDLRIIALLLVLTEIGSTLVAFAIPAQWGGSDPISDIDVTSWFAALIILVLAEVFREGARLRADAELTV